VARTDPRDGVVEVPAQSAIAFPANVGTIAGIPVIIGAIVKILHLPTGERHRY
jgi:hypothetical protein